MEEAIILCGELEFNDCKLKKICEEFCKSIVKSRSKSIKILKYDLDKIIEILCKYCQKSRGRDEIFMCVCDENELFIKNSDADKLLCSYECTPGQTKYDILLVVRRRARRGRLSERRVRLEAKLNVTKGQNIEPGRIEEKLNYCCCGEQDVRKILVVKDSNIKRVIEKELGRRRIENIIVVTLGELEKELREF